MLVEWVRFGKLVAKENSLLIFYWKENSTYMRSFQGISIGFCVLYFDCSQTYTASHRQARSKWDISLCSCWKGTSHISCLSMGFSKQHFVTSFLMSEGTKLRPCWGRDLHFGQTFAMDSLVSRYITSLALAEDKSFAKIQLLATFLFRWKMSLIRY